MHVEPLNGDLQVSYLETLQALRGLSLKPGFEDVATILAYLVQQIDSLEKDGR